MTGGSGCMAPVFNGWSIHAHPVFLGQFAGLVDEVERCRRRHPETWRGRNCAKRLAAILRLVKESIPTDPGSPAFRQGGTLGEGRKHWFRAKFFQRYRLFYRFSSRGRVIVLAWVNDDQTLRSSGARTDVYAVFGGMLDRGSPPDGFDALLAEARAAGDRFRMGLEATEDL